MPGRDAYLDGLLAYTFSSCAGRLRFRCTRPSRASAYPAAVPFLFILPRLRGRGTAPRAVEGVISLITVQLWMDARLIIAICDFVFVARPPPPCCAWSPSPVVTGEDGIFAMRGFVFARAIRASVSRSPAEASLTRRCANASGSGRTRTDRVRRCDDWLMCDAFETDHGTGARRA